MPQGAWLRCERGQQSWPCPQGAELPIQGSSRAPLPQHPGLYSKARQGGTALQRRTKTKTNRSMLFFFFLSSFFFFFHSRPSSQPLLCHPRWNVSPNSSLARCVLLPAFASDCLQRLRFSHTPDHGSGSPWLRAGSASPPARCASAGRGERSRRAPRGSALSHT